MARSAFSFKAIVNALAAPLLNASSTDRPSLHLTTPFTISAGILGTGSPPNTSGQTGISSWSFTKFSTALFSLLPPLYLQFSPRRQALNPHDQAASFVPLAQKSPIRFLLVFIFSLHHKIYFPSGFYSASKSALNTPSGVFIVKMPRLKFSS